MLFCITHLLYPTSAIIKQNAEKIVVQTLNAVNVMRNRLLVLTETIASQTTENIKAGSQKIKSPFTGNGNTLQSRMSATIMA
jgi:hypothetical protein